MLKDWGLIRIFVLLFLPKILHETICWHSIVISKECTVNNSSAFTLAVSPLFQKPSISVKGRRKVMWLVLQGPLEWPNGLGTSSITTGKKEIRNTETKLDTSPYTSVVLRKIPFLFCLEQMAPPMRALVLHHHCQMSLGGFRGLQSLVLTLNTFSTSTIQNCLRCMH